MGNIELIGRFCRDFRVSQLHMSLTALCEISNTNLKTLSAFEHGRSTNFEHFLKYLDVCSETQKANFISSFSKLLWVI